MTLADLNAVARESLVAANRVIASTFQSRSSDHDHFGDEIMQRATISSESPPYRSRSWRWARQHCGRAGAASGTGPAPPYAFPKVEQFTLDNGLKVILVEKNTLPIVEGRLIIDAGACASRLEEWSCLADRETSPEGHG